MTMSIAIPALTRLPSKYQSLSNPALAGLVLNAPVIKLDFQFPHSVVVCLNNGPSVRQGLLHHSVR